MRFYFAPGLIEYEWFLNRSIWSIDETLTGTDIPHQKRFESKGNEGMLNTSQNYRPGASTSDTV